MLWTLLLTLTFASAWAADPPQGGWKTAKRIDANDLSNAPLIAADDRGNAIALWVQSDALPQQYGVWTNRYTAGKGWGQPEHINDYVGQAAELALAINKRGEALAVWAQYSVFDPNNPSAPFSSSLWTNRYTPERGWHKPVQIQDGVNPAGAPKAALDEQGNAMVVWHQQNPALDITNVYARRFSIADGWHRAHLLQADPSNQGYYAQVAMTDDGDAMIAWGQVNLTTYISNVASARYSARTGWAAAEILPGTDNAGLPLIGTDALGDAIAVWTRMDPITFQTNIFASRYGERQGWDVPQLLQPGTDVSADQLRLAVNGRGQAIALWKETLYSYFGDSSYEMHANRYVPGKGWQGSQLVGTTTTYPDTGGSNPQIGMDQDGNAIAVWEQPNFAAQTNLYVPPPTNIQAFRFAPDKGWDSGTLIQNGTDNALSAQISVTGNGDAFAAWQQQDMTTGASSVWANRYDKPHDKP
jgi:hypothetical protein